MKNKFSVLFLFMALISLLSVFKISNKKVYALEHDNKLEINSCSAYLFEPNSGKVIFKKNENERLPIASMCKIMTLLITFEEVDKGSLSLSDSISISSKAMGMGGSQVFLEANTNYPLNDLIKSIVVASANDASVAVAERIAGSEESFVDLMNNKAKELNMTNTNFVNCTGLPKPGQYSSAKDVATMFSTLIKHKDFFTFSNIWMDEINHPNNRKTEISNTNKLIKYFSGCDSGKTGYTSEAGHCLCASAIRNGLRFISVIIKAPDSKTRFKEASDLFNYGFNNYVNKQLLKTNEKIDYEFNINNAKNNDYNLVSEDDFYVLNSKKDKNSYSFKVEIYNDISAPLVKGQAIGKIIIFENGIEISKINAVIDRDVYKKGYFDNVKEVIDNWGIC